MLHDTAYHRSGATTDSWPGLMAGPLPLQPPQTWSTAFTSCDLRQGAFQSHVAWLIAQRGAKPTVPCTRAADRQPTGSFGEPMPQHIDIHRCLSCRQPRLEPSVFRNLCRECVTRLAREFLVELRARSALGEHDVDGQRALSGDHVQRLDPPGGGEVDPRGGVGARANAD
jgi:hypothetical protein